MVVARGWRRQEWEWLFNKQFPFEMMTEFWRWMVETDGGDGWWRWMVETVAQGCECT